MRMILPYVCSPAATAKLTVAAPRECHRHFSSSSHDYFYAWRIFLVPEKDKSVIVSSTNKSSHLIFMKFDCSCF